MTDGDLFHNTTTRNLEVASGGAWVVPGPVTTISTTDPVGGVDNDIWFKV